MILVNRLWNRLYTICQYETAGSAEDIAHPGSTRMMPNANDRRIRLISKWNLILTAPGIMLDINRGCDKQISL